MIYFEKKHKFTFIFIQPDEKDDMFLDEETRDKFIMYAKYTYSISISFQLQYYGL